MRICRLTWNFPRPSELTHGLGPNFYYISREQARLGHEVHVISSSGPSTVSSEELNHLTVHRVKFPYSINAMKKLMTLHREAPLDIVHAHGTCGITYPALFRARVKRPLVVHVHGTTLGSRRRFFGERSRAQADTPRTYAQESITLLRQRYFWRSADLLVAVSEAVRRELIELYRVRSEKVTVVHNGIDPQVFRRLANPDEIRSGLKIDRGKRIILYVGHFGPRKGLGVLLEAMPLILSTVPDALLLAVGGIPEWLGDTVSWSRLHETIRSQHLEDSVKLLPQVQHQTLPNYYSTADVFVLPSYYEAFPKVVLEAMACETPVIATRTGGIPEMVRDGVNGFLVEPGNPRELADRLISILQDESYARKIASEGAKTVRSSFTWQHTARALLEAYQRVV